MNGYYIRNMEKSRLKKLLEEQIRDFLAGKDVSELEDRTERSGSVIEKIIPLVKERIKTIKGSIDLVKPFFIKIKYTKGFYMEAS